MTRVLTYCAVVIFIQLLSACVGSDGNHAISSPDGMLEVSVGVIDGKAVYSINYQGRPVMIQSPLGIRLENLDFTSARRILTSSSVEQVEDRFVLVQGKRRENHYNANRRTFTFQNNQDEQFDVIFQVSNDGVAFRYSINGASDTAIHVLDETTGFQFPRDTKAFIQPMSDPKTGWSKVNPCYEESYNIDVDAASMLPRNSGWVLPALFRTNDDWTLITEAALDRTFCGSRLIKEGNGFVIGYPDSLETFPGGGVLPRSVLPLKTPWRVLTIGSLQTIIESNLSVALAEPVVKGNFDFVEPGHASWSWALYKDDSTIMSVQKRFVDHASAMRWKYCLVDAEWDKRIGKKAIEQLAAYAASKNVGLLLWYNSAGDWNETPLTPRDRMLTRESRRKEFAWLKDIGVRGVKIDFFGGDGQSFINYYLDILDDAADFNLLVNFHGSTIPRGWQRTYPHLMTMEAVKGFEYITFDQANADEQPRHCTTLPFIRNVVDPMDFTPLSLDTIRGVTRRTTNAFELALPIIFLSGIQHLVETPEGVEGTGDSVQDYLRTLPTTWDDTKFISGYPGKEVIVARRSGGKWYVAGINGEDKMKVIDVQPPVADASTAVLLRDGSERRKIQYEVVQMSPVMSIQVKSYGGFVMIVE